MASQVAQDSSRELLEELKQFSEAFAHTKLASYVERLKKAGTPSKASKEINDAIWGTVRVQPLEVAILDSPLLQRLRSIRQLGVIHWIYPGAVHTRFEHTLGVLHQAQELITAVNNASPSEYGVAIDTDLAGLVRLCALLHDVGHGVFSHVSEHSLIRNADLRLALSAFARANGLGKTQLSEVIAYYLVGSPAFRELLETLLDQLGSPIRLADGAATNAAEISSKIQSAIIGKSISDAVPLLHELITGPFDADKLDYFVRDAKLTGVPSVLDISRLLQKISVRVVTAKDLPTPIGSQVSAQAHYYLFGLKWSGAAVLDELHLARVLLYAKIYRHQKVLATEAMIDSLLDSLAHHGGATILQLVQLTYRYSDDELLWSDAQDILSMIGGSDAQGDLTLFVNDILARLRERRLYVNSLAVRASYPGDPWVDNKRQKTGLSQFVEDIRNPELATRLKEQVVGEIESIHNLAPSAIPETFDPALIKHSVAISAKSRLSGGTEIDRAFVFQGQKVVPYRDLSGVNRPAWADAYDLAAASGYIFCPREIATACYVAIEKTLRLEYDVILPAAALELSKQSTDDVTELKLMLEQSGYFNAVPHDIRATPRRLTKADVEPFMVEMAQKFDLVDEPAEGGEERRATDLSERIHYWLKQFRLDDHISCAMELLKATRILGRDDTKLALTEFAAQHPEFKGSTIVLLGGLKDSSAVQAYFSRDVESLFPRVMTVEEAAAKEISENVVFLDDFIGSGGQVRDLFGNWFEIEDLKNPALSEQRELFGEREREYLRSRKAGFVFAAGWNDGLNAITEIGAKVGLDVTAHVALSENDIPFAFDGVLSDFDPQMVRSFKECCERVGRELLLADGKEAGVAAERALGYGNRAMLLVSRYNVPTQVLTCFWRAGAVDGVPWLPLISRRRKS